MKRTPKDLVCGLGAVFVDEDKSEKFFFSCELNPEQRRILGELSKKQIIFEAESFCAVLAYMLWMRKLEKRNSLLYLDNEGTKFCLMKGSSDNEFVDVLCSIFDELEIVVETSCWLARVPSHSNIADKQSRGQTHELRAKGFCDHFAFALEERRLSNFLHS